MRSLDFYGSLSSVHKVIVNIMFSGADIMQRENIEMQTENLQQAQTQDT